MSVKGFARHTKGRSKGKPHPVHKKKTMFGDPRYKKYAQMVKLDTEDNAKQATEDLMNAFWRAKTRATKIRILRVTVLAMNRANAMRKRRNLTSKERKELRKIAEWYCSAKDSMKHQLDVEAKEGNLPATVKAQKAKGRVFVDRDNKYLVLPTDSLVVQGFAEQVEKTPKGYVYSFRFKKDLDIAVKEYFAAKREGGK